jgi:hypothetical protein
MGRPIDQTYLGPTGATPSTIPVRANIEAGGGEFEGYIVSQKSNMRFTISNDAGTEEGLCTLVNKITGLDDGECAIVGIVAGPESRLEAIQKITAHRAVGFNGTVYTWAVSDDSTESLLLLTAL